MAAESLLGRVALVTGAGRSRGIGYATAIALARAGADVVVTDLARAGEKVAGVSAVAEDREGIDACVSEIEALGRRALGLPLDVTSESEAVEVVSAAVDRFGGIDIAFNNAGTPMGVAPFLELTPRQWAVSWEVNVMGTVNVCKAAIPVLLERGGGSIINNSSLSGLKGLPNYGAYTATKHAVVGLTRSMALEFGTRGIRVNTICPGDIETDMTDIGIALAREQEGSVVGEVSLSPLDTIALRRRGLPADVADVVVWLASDAASYVTGAAIKVDGGLAEGI